MSVDQANVRRIARLARIAVRDDELPHLAQELNAMLAFVEELNAVDLGNAEPMTSVLPMQMKMRQDVVGDHAGPEIVTGNAPISEDHFFLVPKVIE